ncbi:MAG: RNA 2',3'-cyclic phosphodiesterase [Candidatus Izimaplasma sp.]|nr:RNA 2',3'-cyclic phosphodiesterase [Candidatus Izimaplasma bacterium]
MMRVFFAVEFSDDEKNQIAHEFQLITPKIKSGKPTRKSNYHITLKYIGESSQEDIEKMKHVLREVASHYQKFNIELTHFSTFKKGTKRILYLGTNKNNPLNSIQTRLDHVLNTLGYPLENHVFKPHVTLSRKTVLDTVQFPQIQSIEIRVLSISLMQSHHVNNQLTYSRIFHQELQNT